MNFLTPDVEVVSGLTAADAKECRIFLGSHAVSDFAPLTVHVDTIMEIVRMAHESPDFANLSIKGRDLDDPQDMESFEKDPLVHLMLYGRANVRADQFRELGRFASDIKVDVSDRTELGAGEKYPCRYHKLSGLVEGVLSGSMTANHLLPKFGGASVIVLADTLGEMTQDELRDWGKGLWYSIDTKMYT